jgi:hypothetical protein
MAELTQLPDVVDIKFVAGDTFRIRVRVINPADGDPLPLTEYGFRAQIAKETDRTIVAEFDVTPDPDAPAEAVVLTLPPADTAVLPGMGNGNEFIGKWDLEVTFPPHSGQAQGDIRTVAKGSVSCFIDVTNSGSP